MRPDLTERKASTTGRATVGFKRAPGCAVRAWLRVPESGGLRYTVGVRRLLNEIQASLLRMTPEQRAAMKSAVKQLLAGGTAIASGLTLTAGTCLWAFAQLGVKVQLGTTWPEFVAELRQDAAAVGPEVAALFDGVF